MSGARAVALLALAGGAMSGCADIDTGVTTSPAAHESAADAPEPPSPVKRIDGGRFLGGAGLDLVDDIAVDDAGNFYVVGGTASLDFPVTVGDALDSRTSPDCAACPFDGFVASLAPTGAARWIRLIQSGGYDRMTSVAVHGGAVWVAGSTGDREDDAGFRGGLHPERGAQDGLLCRLDAATGQALDCRYVGGSGASGIADLAVAPDGSELVAVTTVVAGEDLHLDPGYADAFTGAHRATSTSDDGLLLAFEPDDLTLRWATYVGGSGAEGGTPSVARDASFTFVAIDTTSSDAPTVDAVSTTLTGGTDAYFAAFRSDGTALQIATYLGGSGDERVGHNSLAGVIDELYLGLSTRSTDMPAGLSPSDTVFDGDGGPDCGEGDVWLAHLRPAASATLLLGTSYLGGAQGERFGGLTRFEGDFLRSVAVVIETHSDALRTPEGAQPFFSSKPCMSGAPGRTDAYVAVLTPSLSLESATYLGGNGADGGIAVAQRADGPIAVVGATESTVMPWPTSVDDSYGGAVDGFFLAYDPRFIPPGPGGLDGGSGNDPDAGIPPGYDEGLSGCCGASTSSGSALGLGLGVLILLFRRRHPR